MIRWWLYVLKLEDDKWYVGITSKSPEERFYEHLHHKRAAYWTMKYKPLEIEITEDLGVVSKEHAEKYENKITRLLMKERGLNNVRGGDLRSTTPYVIRFGYIFDKEGWRNILYIGIILIILIAFYIDKYLVSFMPGGVR